MKIIKMSNLDMSGKRVLIREDLNVPIKDGVVTSDARIRAAIPTIQAALAAKAHVLVMSHLGRPEEGKFSEDFSLAPVAKRLTQLLGVPVALKRDWLDGVTVGPGEVVLLENVRFNKGEKSDSDELAKKMAALCDIYVMDAFGTAHRAEASTHGVAKYARWRVPVRSWSASCRRWKQPWKSRRGRCWRSWADRRYRPSSPCSNRF